MKDYLYVPQRDREKWKDRIRCQAMVAVQGAVDKRQCSWPARYQIDGNCVCSKHFRRVKDGVDTKFTLNLAFGLKSGD